jgi:hypothetical protein
MVIIVNENTINVMESNYHRIENVHIILHTNNCVQLVLLFIITRNRRRKDHRDLVHPKWILFDHHGRNGQRSRQINRVASISH